MDKMLLNISCRASRLKASSLQRGMINMKNTRPFHASVFRATKPFRGSSTSKGSSKKAAQKKQFLEYKTPTPRPNPASESSHKPKENPLRFRTIPIIFGSLTLFCISGYITYLYVSISRPSLDTSPAIDADFTTQEDVSSTYSKIAPTFDTSVEATEYSMGIHSLRGKLASLAQGDVLEVSIGTGRNLDFYDWDFKGHYTKDEMLKKKGKVRSFTAVDKSEEMLEIAHEKFAKMFPGILGVRWIIDDAAEEGKIPGPPRNANERSGNLEGKYDTVVQTFGLCSVSDPVALLKNLGQCVKEDEGRILLLEHGRGRWEWLNNYLDKSAAEHANKFGCWWNRDMRDIVEKSGLEVVKIETPKWWHGGTTWWIELKKPKSKIVQIEKVEEKPPEPAPSPLEVETKKRWLWRDVWPWLNE